MKNIKFGHSSDTEALTVGTKNVPTVAKVIRLVPSPTTPTPQGNLITDKMVKKLSPADTGRIIYDDQIPGFGVRITPAGAISFVLNYCIHGRERRYTIGRYPEISALVARGEALQLRAGIRNGHDPLAERARARSVLTVADFAEEYLHRHAEPNKSAYGLRDDKRYLKKYVKPRLGSFALDAVRRSDIESLRRDLAETPVQFNRALALLHTLFEKAKEWEHLGSECANPAHGVKRYREEPRRRWAQESELAELLKILDKEEDQEQANAVRLILLTGSRKGETLSATWDQFDLERGTWTKPSHATKQRRTETVPLSASAVELLRKMKGPQASGWLFPGKDGNHRKDVRKFWTKVRQAGKFEDLNPHDLRHTFASHLVSGGAPLALVGGLLGHTQARTTQRYAHLADQPLRNLANQFGKVYQKSQKRRRGKTS
jgi:integrase